MSDEYVLTPAAAGKPAFALSGSSIKIGRETDCDIRFPDDQRVSRNHARLFQDDTGWCIEDEGSTNGTLVNGREIHSAVALRPGDRIQIGIDGPAFFFNHKLVQHAVNPRPAVKRPGGGLRNAAASASSLRLSEVLPFISKGKLAPMKGEYLIPGIVLIVLTVLLFALISGEGNALAEAGRTGSVPSLRESVAYGRAFVDVLGLYLAGFGLYEVVKLAGRRKPFWVYAIAFMLTAFVLLTPIFVLIKLPFLVLAGGDLPRNAAFGLGLIYKAIVAVGLPEELTKAIPVLLFVWIGLRAGSPAVRAEAGVHDPLDGMLVAAASATGFMLVETLGQYVPDAFCQFATSYCGQSDAAIQAAFGSALVGVKLGEGAALQLMLPRILGDIGGHMAYAGYFGYCIGLGMIRRRHFWRLLATGWAGAALLHGLWDSTSALSPVVYGAVGVASFVVFISALRRARHLTGLSQSVAAAAARP